LSVNGNRARSNNFQIDGSDNNDLSVSGPALFVDAQDSLQEYQVITNNFSAQYGRNQGAIVNLVTKSGTNDFHGTLFEYHRDRRALEAVSHGCFNDFVACVYTEERDKIARLKQRNSDTGC
jgi:outer membrane receptor protein involved in Fe transport